MRSLLPMLSGLSLLLCTSTHAATAPAEPLDPNDLLQPPAAPLLTAATDGRIEARGGEFVFVWNDDMLRDLGMRRSGASPSGEQRSERVPLTGDSSITAGLRGKGLRPLTSGNGGLAGSFRFTGRDGKTIDWRTPRFTVRPGEALRFDFQSTDGRVLFYADRLMYDLVDGGKSFQIRSMDLRLAPALAFALGHPEFADIAVAEIKALMPVVSSVAGDSPKACGDPNWPGEAAPAAQTYLADVFMTTFTAQYSRCRAGAAGGTCDGPGGASDGQIVFTPSSTLLNNVNNGTPVATVAGDPLGTSSALYSADVEWEAKFTNAVAGPYGATDQHPYLIWNLYRTDADGILQQVGRSGVKHAFLTINVGSGCESCNGGHVLGRSCSDTYGVGNNDSSSDLGPRRELIPARGQWGRCRSIYDLNCDGASNASGNSTFDQRLIVRESALDVAANVGASWLFESWYLVREDINIYNTMATRPVTPAWNGSMWSVSNGTPLRLGSALDRWVAAASAGVIARSDELDTAEGHAKLGLRVTDLGGGTWRYQFALMNFDFARAVTQGAEPNLEVLRNNGLSAFALNVASAATISDVRFVDGDLSSTNDWAATRSGSTLTWRAPDVGASLNWGSLVSFGFVANIGPTSATAQFEVAELGMPSSYSVNTLAPAGIDAIFSDGFE